MKIACIVQRYGDQIVGGAEFHCRLIAEHLSAIHHVEVLTTCAVDYLTWENVLPEGIEQIGPCQVRRFRILSGRPQDFDAMAYQVLHFPSTRTEQEAYLQSHGPYAPDLIEHLKIRTDIDVFIFFSYRYWITCKGLSGVGSRSILVPTAEHDRAIYLEIYHETFRQAAQVAFNSEEEKDIIVHASGIKSIPGETVGVGVPDSEPATWDDVSKRWDIDDRYVLYLGRIERSKGCEELISFFLRYVMQSDAAPQLVLIGKQHLVVPDHSRILNLGVLPEHHKLALLKHAMFLIMPSRFESLSMVLLEAWKLKRPVMVNGCCEVLRGQCLRSQGGLYYRNYDQFFEVMELMTHNDALLDRLGQNGHQYFLTRYSWDVILRKYETMLNQIVSTRRQP